MTCAHLSIRFSTPTTPATPTAGNSSLQRYIHSCKDVSIKALRFLDGYCLDEEGSVALPACSTASNLHGAGSTWYMQSGFLHDCGGIEIRAYVFLKGAQSLSRLMSWASLRIQIFQGQTDSSCSFLHVLLHTPKIPRFCRLKQRDARAMYASALLSDFQIRIIPNY